MNCLVRGLNPWPSAYTFYNGKTLKIWDADVVDEAIPADAVPGQVLQADKHGFTVAAGEGILKINELQLEGKKRMAADALLRGFTYYTGRDPGTSGVKILLWETQPSLYGIERE